MLGKSEAVGMPIGIIMVFDGDINLSDQTIMGLSIGMFMKHCFILFLYWEHGMVTITAAGFRNNMQQCTALEHSEIECHRKIVIDCHSKLLR